MPDVFAFALLGWFLICAASVRARLMRLETMIVLIAGWLASVVGQQASGDIVPLQVFVCVDVGIVVWLVSLFGQRRVGMTWAKIAVICHGLMLIGHAIQHYSGWPSPSVYVTYLNALGYISAGAVAGGPMTAQFRRWWEARLDAWYHTALRRQHRRDGDLHRAADQDGGAEP
jgi:hypothetical protein